MNKNIEVEGGEIAIRNSHGDLAIIPKDKRDWVKQKLSEGCHSCIDKLVETLPVMEDYAQDGSLYSEYLTPDSPTKKHPLDPNPDGSLPSYFKGSKENPIELDEYTVTAEAPEWVKYRKEYVKNNPFNIDEYVENRFNNPVGREKIEKIDQEGWRKKLKQEGLEKRYNSAMDYVGEQLVKNKPQGKLSRAEWLNQMTDKEEEIIKRNPKYQSSLWVDTKRGLTSLVEQNYLQTFQNILNSSDYSNREKQEMLKDYIDHPVMSKLGDAAKILAPVTVGSKVLQSNYRDDTTFVGALKGEKNNASFAEDALLDVTNLSGLGLGTKLLKGVGLASKLSKADKVIDATKVGSKVLNKTDDVVKSVGRKQVGANLDETPLKPLHNSGNVTNYYHGSPWRWENDLFDVSMIGKGEGAAKRMQGLNLFPEKRLNVAPKFANIKSADAPIHIGSSNKIEQSLLNKLNPTIYKFEDIGNKLKLKELSGRQIKKFKQEDLIKEGFDGIRTEGQITVFPNSVHKLTKSSAQSIEEFVKANPNVKNWVKWTTNIKEYERVTGLKLSTKELEELKDLTIRYNPITKSK